MTKFLISAIIAELNRHILVKMARKKRVEFPGAFYHVLTRGNNKQKVFKDEQDYKIYLIILRRYHNRYKFTLYAYTLMPNHIHLLIETGVTPLSKIMQGIQQSYTYYFHKKYKSVGHIFQGRYKAILCERETYLLELVRYIHLNPVRAGLVDNADDYPWSSHPVYLGHLEQSFVEKEFIFKIFSGNKPLSEKKYRQFIGDGVDKGNRDDFYNVIDQLYLGAPEFVESNNQRIKNQMQNKTHRIEKSLEVLQIKDLLITKKKSLPEILKTVSEITKVSPRSIFGSNQEQYVSDARSLFIFIAVREGGITNKSLANFLGRSPSDISYLIRKIDDRINSDQVVSNQLNKILKILKA